MRRGQSSQSWWLGSPFCTYSTISSSVKDPSLLPAMTSSNRKPSIMRSQWSTGKYDTQADSPQTPKNLSKKNQHEQVGTQNRAAQLSLARRGQRQRWTGHRTCRRKSTPGNTSMNQEKKGGYEETHTRAMEKNESKWDSPAILRRWTSWSNFRATGWSHGYVLVQSLNCSWVHRRNRACRHSWPIGRWCRIFNMSNRIAIGTEYNTIDSSELTILTSTTEQSGMSQHWARNVI